MMEKYKYKPVESSLYKKTFKAIKKSQRQAPTLIRSRGTIHAWGTGVVLHAIIKFGNHKGDG